MAGALERMAPLVVLAFALAAFAPTLEHGFVYDDHLTIVHNPAVVGADPLAPWTQPFWPRGTSVDLLYRPLALQSLRADAWPADGAPSPLRVHLVQLLLHATCALLVAAIGRILLGAAGGFVAGLLFAVHPLQTEAVATGYGRSELLAALFCLLALRRHVVSREPGGPLELALLVFLAGASKEHALLLWPGLVGVEVLALARRGRPGQVEMLAFARRHLPAALALAMLLALRVNALGALSADTSRMGPLVAPAAHADLAGRAMLSARLAALSARLLVDPARLTPVWSAPALAVPTRIETDVGFGFALLAAAAVGLAALWRRGGQDFAIAGLGALFLALPLQVIAASSWLFAERWLYLPVAFFAWGAAMVFCRLPPSTTVATALAVGLVLTVQSREYAECFRDDLTMARETVRRLPDGYQGYRNLATALLQAARTEEAGAAARDSERRFGPQPETTWVLSRACLARGDAECALRELAVLRRLLPSTGAWLDEEERRIRSGAR